MTKRINNLKKVKSFRKHLRSNLTPPEAFLWNYLKKSQIEGKKFRRQHSIGPYVLDFYCPEEKLAIELDGHHHFTEDGINYDEKRTRYLNGFGVKVLRFENKVVFEFTERVLDEIRNNLLTIPS
ncbi:MAG: endonuclease domain-containing protein [Bacteroidia bacterium]